MKAEKERGLTAKSKDAKQERMTRRGIVLISVLAVLILLVNIITASFSWFTPNEVAGSGMEYKTTVQNRSEMCEFFTASGLKQTDYDQSEGIYVDAINYSDIGLDYTTIGAHQTAYFRTSITNKDEDYPTDISLYFASFGQSGSNLTVAVSYPSNTVRTVSGEQTDFCLLRNAYVKRKDVNDVDGPGLLEVDWFIINNGDSSVTIDLDPESKENSAHANMYLMYN